MSLLLCFALMLVLPFLSFPFWLLYYLSLYWFPYFCTSYYFNFYFICLSIIQFPFLFKLHFICTFFCFFNSFFCFSLYLDFLNSRILLISPLFLQEKPVRDFTNYSGEILIVAHTIIKDDMIDQSMIWYEMKWYSIIRYVTIW